MRVIVVGLGVQGAKRKLYAKNDFIASVDPNTNKAEYNTVREVPLSSFDTALVCLPDEPKYEVIKYLLTNRKHVMVEKPLWTESKEQLIELEQIAQKNNVICYTAYNHRFEPHFMKLKQILDDGILGRIYHLRMFYGNGTARLVKNSPWRDKGLGVINDLGSHLLDTMHFWFGETPINFQISTINSFENRAPDHAIIKNRTFIPQCEFEMSLLSWRNHFTCDVFAKYGTAHISSLCKWGPSKFVLRKRILPSGRPTEESETLIQPDPTWQMEYLHFKALIEKEVKTDLKKDFQIYEELNQLHKSYALTKREQVI